MSSRLYLVLGLIITIYTKFTTPNTLKAGKACYFIVVTLMRTLLFSSHCQIWSRRLKFGSCTGKDTKRYSKGSRNTKLSRLSVSISPTIPFLAITWGWMSLLWTHRVFLLLRETTPWCLLLFSLRTILQSIEIPGLRISRRDWLSMPVPRLSFLVC